MQNNNSKLNTVLLVVLIILALGIIWILWHDRKAEEGKDNYQKMQIKQVNTIDSNKSKEDWVKSPTFGLYYSSNYNAPVEFYRVSGLGPDRGKIVYEPTTDTVPVFSLVFSDGRTGIMWGDVWKGGHMPGTCTDDEFGPFEYGVSSLACVRGYRTSVAHFSARESVTKDELKIFGDFVLKNK